MRQYGAMTIQANPKQIDVSTNLLNEAHQILKLYCFSSRHADVFDQSIEARC